VHIPRFDEQIDKSGKIEVFILSDDIKCHAKYLWMELVLTGVIAMKESLLVMHQLIEC